MCKDRKATGPTFLYFKGRFFPENLTSFKKRTFVFVHFYLLYFTCLFNGHDFKKV